METINYEEILPKSYCNPGDAMEVLMNKFSYFCREGLFESDEFTQLFGDRVEMILNHVDDDDEELQKMVETEFAYMYHDLYGNHGITYFQSEDTARLRALESCLDDEGILQPFLAFVRKEVEHIDMNKENWGECLEYLSRFVPNRLQDAVEYIETCVRLSQIPEGFDVLLAHIFTKFNTFQQKDIEATITLNKGYLGEKLGDFESRVAGTIKENPEMGWNNAETEVMEFQERLASVHVFLGEIYNDYIAPLLNTVSEKEQNRIRGLLNDLHDLLDPDAHIPLNFYTGNIGECTERDRLFIAGRSIQ